MHRVQESLGIDHKGPCRLLDASITKVAHLGSCVPQLRRQQLSCCLVFVVLD